MIIRIFLGGINMVSVIIPSYNEDKMILKTASIINTILMEASIPNELIFIDDGSNDKTWEKIISASKTFSNVRGIHFSKNFGKESAILAGLKESSGNCCVVIDCDLQHPPIKIVEMYHLWLEGYEIVEGRKVNRGKENKLHSLAAKSFYALISGATGFDMSNTSDFKLLDRKVVNVLTKMRERNMFFRALSSWVGFKTTCVDFEVQERIAGTSKWSTLSLFKYALRNISSFSTVPLQLVTILGVIMLLISLIFGSILLGQIFSGQAIDAISPVIIIILFSSSFMMISLGIIGYYIAKIYDEVKERPRYIIADFCGSPSNE